MTILEQFAVAEILIEKEMTAICQHQIRKFLCRGTV